MATVQTAGRQLSSNQQRERRHSSWWEDAWRRLLAQRSAVIAGAVLLVILCLAALAPWVAPHDPLQQYRDIGLSPLGQPLPPNQIFWLGTDGLGRDLFSRLLYGARVSLGIGIAASAIAVTIGLLVGGMAGFHGGKIDFLTMRFVDLVMSMPTFFIILLLVVMLRPGVWVVITVIALFSWTAPARVFRGQMLSTKRRDFVQAAQSVGVPQGRIFVRHLLPHILPLVVVYLALTIPAAIFTEASLSFLGLGVPQPTPSWGSMIQDGFAYYRAAPWIAFFPGMAIAVTVVCLNLLGAGLREAMDPIRKKK